MSQQLQVKRFFQKNHMGIQFARYEYVNDEGKTVLLSQTICNDRAHAALNDKLAAAEAKNKFGSGTDVQFS